MRLVAVSRLEPSSQLVTVSGLSLQVDLVAVSQLGPPSPLVTVLKSA